MPHPDYVDAVLRIVARIPTGRVMTYGDVGLAIDSHAPRAVGRVLALFGDASPWWRVVPASGHPPQGHARLALPHYLAEGTPLRHAPESLEAAEARPEAFDIYRIALSAARLPYSHEIYAEVAL